MEQAMNNMDHQYDTTSRLSAEDKQMMTRVSSCNRFSEIPTVRNMTPMRHLVWDTKLREEMKIAFRFYSIGIFPFHDAHFLFSFCLFAFR